jgi:hypothetical protein
VTDANADSHGACYGERPQPVRPAARRGRHERLPDRGIAVPKRLTATPPAKLPRRETLVGRFESEGRDGVWVTAYEREAQASLAKSFPEDHIEELRCETSLCRIRIAHPSLDDQLSFVSHYWASLPSGDWAASHEQEAD